MGAMQRARSSVGKHEKGVRAIKLVATTQAVPAISIQKIG